MITLYLFEKTSSSVIPVKTGIQNLQPWIPASAGMTSLTMCQRRLKTK